MQNNDRAVRWLLGAICFVTSVGGVCLLAVLYSPIGADAAVLGVMAGFFGIALTGLVASLKGSELVQKLNSASEKVDSIERSVNGQLDNRLTLQDNELAEIRRIVSGQRGDEG